MIRFALAALLFAVPCSAQSLVKDKAVLRLTPRTEKHVRDGHFPGGRNTRGKSVFNSGVDLAALLKDAEKAKPRRERNGRLKRVIETDAPIGTDGYTGKPVKSFVVISETDGVVVTMYPGR